VEQRSCASARPCSERDFEGGDRPLRPSASVSIAGEEGVQKFGTIWRPLFAAGTISPCACGCIYIVGDRRRVAVTSGRDCLRAPSPLRWRLKVRNDYGESRARRARRLFRGLP